MLTDVTGTADHVLRNRAVWDEWASGYAGAGLRNWSAAEPTWGIWGIAEAQAGLLPPALDGADSIELGCGTGYVSEFHLGHGDMIRLLRRCGLEVEDLLELRPAPGAVASHPLATIEWARQWPCEEVWKARKLDRA
jgi:hypothetical protein